jgi:hypothetical protein
MSDGCLIRPLAHRPGDHDVVRRVDVHTDDAPRKLEISHDSGERRLVRRRDEDRVDVAVTDPSLGRKGMSRPRHCLAGEREVAVFELELVQRCNAIERARRRSHELGANTIPGQARNGLRHSILLHSLRRGRA